MSVDWKSFFKTRLAYARKIAGITQDELAKRSNTSATYLRHLEADNKKLSGTMAGTLAAVLGVSGHWLMGRGNGEPVDHEGQPYSREKYLDTKDAKDTDPILNREKMLRRAEEWKTYLKAQVDEAFTPSDRYPTYLRNPGWPESLGCGITAAIRELAQNPDAKISETLIDDFVKQARAKQDHNIKRSSGKKQR
jgi:transcriptional regulator with XRE-family HTH domain